MNILFTNVCNRNCVYCFAKGKLTPGRNAKGRYLSLKDLRIIIEFLKKSRCSDFDILGGEPTLHPFFKRLVKIILREGFDITIFSNGMITEDTALFLRSIDKKNCGMVLNINHPEDYGKGEYGAIEKTLQILGDRVTLGFNIYKTDVEMDFMIDLIKKYSLRKKVRLGIASPILAYKNKYVCMDDHKKVSSKIVDFAQKCDRLDIRLGFDCGFTLCSFSNKQLGRLIRYNSALSMACTPTVDVAPDLAVWRCFPTSLLWNRRLTDFGNINEVLNFFNKKFSLFHRVGAREECLRCKYLRRRQCAGGCLGHTLKAFNLGERIKYIDTG